MVFRILQAVFFVAACLLGLATPAMAGSSGSTAPEDPPRDHTYDLTPITFVVGAHEFRVPSAFLPTYHPQLYIESTLPDVGPVNDENADCFRHWNLCKERVRISLTPGHPASFAETEDRFLLKGKRRVHNDRLDLDEYFTASGSEFPYFRAVDEGDEILIACDRVESDGAPSECTSFEEFLGSLLRVSFMAENLAQWRSIRGAVRARISSFEVK
ncbi:hypothetical protein GCM10011611_02990 [Aliidongia dinghuensis]|uniref:Uncharacterized protein n=1 Tax=Aliidongia dinghuensis TaxID=1867774 RepID=A0A8J3E1L1_9PROT|nr:hypothetical protein [Aliidongia dinghuensis]GGF00815.1 hypothetical protein GCM10011611_02990 [Aliidongia dinghuensis]